MGGAGAPSAIQYTCLGWADEIKETCQLCYLILAPVLLTDCMCLTFGVAPSYTFLIITLYPSSCVEKKWNVERNEPNTLNDALLWSFRLFINNAAVAKYHLPWNRKLFFGCKGCLKTNETLHMHLKEWVLFFFFNLIWVPRPRLRCGKMAP